MDKPKQPLPLLYAKLARLIRESGYNEATLSDRVARDEFLKEVSWKFRVSKGELAGMMGELDKYGVLRRVTQRTIAIKPAQQPDGFLPVFPPKIPFFSRRRQ